MSKLADKRLLTLELAISGSKANCKHYCQAVNLLLVPRLWLVLLCFLQLFQQVKVSVFWRKLLSKYITTN